MSPALQAKLLRALQEKEVVPVGAHQPIPVDIRVLAATNIDLKARLADGSFRRDLYYRIAGATILVPPLRERREDISGLIEHFMRAAADDLGKPVKGITAKALRLLVAAPWPGNIRQLEHEVHRLISVCPAGSAADSKLLSAEILDPEQRPLDADDFDFNAQVAALERRLIATALDRMRWNQTRAAELLGISRNGLRIKMERYGLNRDD
jgi:two-component system response regulator HupR/HoxA